MSVPSMVNTNAFQKRLVAVCDDVDDACFVPLKVPYYSHFKILFFIRIEKPHMIQRLNDK